MDEKKEKGLNIILGVIYLIIVSGMSILSNANPGLVFIGTTPILFHLITLHVLNHEEDRNRLFFWGSPFIFSAALFIIWSANSMELISSMDGPSLFVLNTVISYSYNLFIVMINFRSKKFSHFLKDEENKKQIRAPSPVQNYFRKKAAITAHENKVYKEKITNLEQQIKEATAELIITKKNFSINLRSIEDKCKAINFVIGRVYSNKKGGSKEIREKIRIKPELYNEFSAIASNFNDKYANHLLGVLEQIKKRLILLELEERTLFKPDSNPMIELKRSDYGNDKIIQVLKNNDKDPIYDYYTEAKEICERLISFLKKEYVII